MSRVQSLRFGNSLRKYFRLSWIGLLQTGVEEHYYWEFLLGCYFGDVQGEVIQMFELGFGFFTKFQLCNNKAQPAAHISNRRRHNFIHDCHHNLKQVSWHRLDDLFIRKKLETERDLTQFNCFSSVEARQVTSSEFPSKIKPNVSSSGNSPLKMKPKDLSRAFPTKIEF